MKLYLISQNVNEDYDTYDAAVVCAESEDEARKIHPNGDYNRFVEDSWVYNINDVTVEYIGEASEHISKGVVLASFRAG
jgi:hypothetical protein